VQPCRYDTNSSGTPLKLCTDATPSGSMLDFTYGFNWGSKDNGDVMSMAATGQQTFSRSYTYDQLNRLFTMSAPGDPCSGLSWGYDQWGNRTAQTTTGGTCSSSQLTYTTANQISNPGFTYDASGNVTHDANNSYFYDAENHIIQVNGTPGSCPTATACYGYDAFGRRDAKADVMGQFDYLYDLDGNVVGGWEIIPGYNNWGDLYVYLQGRLLALYQNDTVYFAHSDHLSSTRLLTTLTKTAFDSMDYLPFGEQIAGGSGTTHKFTGMERDSETTSNLDNFEARYMGSTLGRFMSPDPANAGADSTNPQSWNMYSYVLNNPLNAIDPFGLDCIAIAQDGTVASDDGEYTRDQCGGFNNLGNGAEYVYVSGTATSASISGDGTYQFNYTDTNGNQTYGNYDPGSGSLSDPYGNQLYNANDYAGNSSSSPSWNAARLTLTLAGMEATHDLGCVPIPGAGAAAGSAMFRLGQPVPGSKPFVTPGSSTGTSPASSALRDTLPQKLPFSVPTPVGGPGTGTPFRMASTNSLGGAAGRYVPVAGAALTVYSAYKMNQCLDSKP
jgi:RHS repeat-associated protein